MANETTYQLEIYTNGSGGQTLTITHGTTYSVSEDSNRIDFSDGQSVVVIAPEDAIDKKYFPLATWPNLTGTITSDGIIEAIFEYTPYYYVQLSCGKGIDSVTPSEKTYYKGGTSVTISAKETDGYAFTNWSDGDSKQERTFDIADNVVLIAHAQYIQPTCIINSNRRVKESGETSVAGDGEVAYINFTVKNGTGTVSGVAINGERVGSSEGTYDYWSEQEETVSKTYIIEVYDQLGKHEYTVYISTANMPLSLYDNGSGDVGVGIGMFGTANNINIGKGNKKSSKPMKITAHDLNGNTASRSVYDLVNLIDIVYPVGSIYQSTVNKSPAEFLGGEWTQLTDVFLVSAGGSYEDKSTGGNAETTLQVTNLPSHSHSFSGSGSTSGAGGHSHTVSGDTGSSGYGTFTIRANMVTGTSGKFSTTTSGSLGVASTSGSTAATIVTLNSHAHSFSVESEYVNDHSHSVSVSGSIGNTGSGTAFSNLPPYYAVYMWERTA